MVTYLEAACNLIPQDSLPTEYIQLSHTSTAVLVRTYEAGIELRGH
jgi:hypothetical protein